MCRTRCQVEPFLTMSETCTRGSMLSSFEALSVVRTFGNFLLMGLEGYLLMMFPEYLVTRLQTVTNRILWTGIWESSFSLSMMSFSIRRTVAGHTSMRQQGVSRKLHTNGLLVTITGGDMSLCFPEGYCTHKSRGITLGQRSPVAFFWPCQMINCARDSIIPKSLQGFH